VNEALYRDCVRRVNRIFDHGKMLRAQALVSELRETEEGLPIAECGVFTGLTGLLLCEHMGSSEYHGFDSFEGLEPGVEDDGAHKACRKGFFAKSSHYAIEVLAGRKAEVHIGHIPDVLMAQPERTYRFAHVDVDCYRPTLESLRYFWPRLMTGGRMVCDDFHWKGAKQACDEFGEPYRLLETGQAAWVKR
jgi:O-methyltransferase